MLVLVVFVGFGFGCAFHGPGFRVVFIFGKVVGFCPSIRVRVSNVVMMVAALQAVSPFCFAKF